MKRLHKGDRVAVIDELTTGEVTAFTATGVVISTESGFLEEYPPEALIPADRKERLSEMLYTVGECSRWQDKKTAHKTSKKRDKNTNKTPVEIDLHSHNLTDSTKKMTGHEILTLQLETARRKLEHAIENRIDRLIIIHGVGEGVLKKELDFLFEGYSNLEYFPASYKRYGTGATEIRIYQNRRLR